MFGSLLVDAEVVVSPAVPIVVTVLPAVVEVALLLVLSAVKFIFVLVHVFIHE